MKSSKINFDCEMLVDGPSMKGLFFKIFSYMVVTFGSKLQVDI